MLLQTPGSRSRSKGNDIRIQTAHIFRLMAGNMQPGTLRTNRNVRHKFLEFVTEALRFVGNSLSGDSSGNLYCALLEQPGSSGDL